MVPPSDDRFPEYGKVEFIFSFGPEKIRGKLLVGCNLHPPISVRGDYSANRSSGTCCENHALMGTVSHQCFCFAP